MTGNSADSAAADEASKSDPATGDPKVFVPPTDGSWIPRERFDQVLGKMGALEAKLEAVAASTDKPKVLTSEELDDAVLNGSMTQEQVNDIKERQVEDRVMARVKADLSTSSQLEKQADELNRYHDELPDLYDEGSELRKSVLNTYRHLVHDLGQPENDGTMVAAIETISGPLSAITAKKGLKKQISPAGETGGGSGGSGNNGEKAQLTDRQKEHYSNAIRMGAYANWDAVHKELEGYGG